MDTPQVIALAREALLLMIVVSAPPLLASLVVGLAASVFQASTQLQESTLSVVPKLCAAVGSLVLAGPWVAGQVTRFTTQVFLALPGVGS